MLATETLITSSLSDVGRTRTENQDACGEFRNDLGERLLVVADGMGGHTGGATASRLCIEAVGRAFQSGVGSPADRLRDGLEGANRDIFQATQQNPELRGMGTTGVALLFEPGGEVWLAWVGDSRAYRFRGGQLEQLSEDHSVVADWVRQGVISAEEAEVHPRRNELLRAIGPNETVEVDVKSYPIEPGDLFLLCSDGLCGYMSDAEISAILGFEPPDQATRQLVAKVNDERNSPDNVTVQIIGVPRDSAVAPDDPDATADQAVPHPPLQSGQSGQSGQPGQPPAGAVEETTEGTSIARVVGLAAAAGLVAGLLAWAGWYGITVGGGGLPERAAAVAVEDPPPPTEVAQPDPVDEQVAGERAPAGEAEERQRRLEARQLADDARRHEEDRKRLERAQAREKQRVAERLAMSKVPAPPVAPSVAAPAEPVPEAPAPSPAAPATPERDEASAASPEASAEGPTPAVARFLEDWARAVGQDDFALYHSLNLPGTPTEFRQRYGPDVAASFDVIEEKPWAGGFVALRVNERLSFKDATGKPRSSETEREIVLRPTPDGLRFAGSRD